MTSPSVSNFLSQTQSWEVEFLFHFVAMVHLYKHLLSDTPMRHIFASIEMDSEKRREQFQRYPKMDVFNFFLLAR